MVFVFYLLLLLHNVPQLLLAMMGDELQLTMATDGDGNEQQMELVEVFDLLQFNESQSASSISSPPVVFSFSPEMADELIEDYLTKTLTINQPATIALICLYAPVFLFSLAGNSFVIVLFVKDRRMRRSKSLFLVNLALSDVAVTVVCIPLVVGNAINTLWLFGEFLCILAGFMQVLTVACSIFTLTALSIDHYTSIKFPRRRGDKSLDSGKRRTVAVLIVIWIVAAVLSGPELHVRHVTRPPDIVHHKLSKAVYCIEEWPTPSNRHVYAIFLLIATYVGPIGVIIASYALVGRLLIVAESSSAAGSSTLRSSIAASYSCNNMLGCSRTPGGGVGTVPTVPCITTVCRPASDEFRPTCHASATAVGSNTGLLLLPSSTHAALTGSPVGGGGAAVISGKDIMMCTSRSAANIAGNPYTRCSCPICYGMSNHRPIGGSAIHLSSGCGLAPPPPPPSVCSGSSSTATNSSSGRKQQRAAFVAAVTAAAADDGVSGLSIAADQPCFLTVNRLTRGSSLQTVMLHPTGCRYLAGGITGAAAGLSANGQSSLGSRDTVERNRRAVVRLLVAIVVVFVASWLPYNVMSLWVDLKFHGTAHVVRLVPFALWLGHAHSAVNPIIYWFFNKTFRNCLRNTLHHGCWKVCNRRRQRDARASQYV